MSVTCQFNGRLGNIVYNLSQLIAYCKKHDLQYYVPTNAWACIGGVVPITVPSTGERPLNPTIYNEPSDAQGYPFYQDIPKIDNVEFRGYYQAFKYFEDYRGNILNVIGLPWFCDKDITSLHIRRGDCVNQPDAFPLAPMEYYNNAISIMLDKGFSKFKIFSDDIPWCREQFTRENYPYCSFHFMEGGTDVQDFVSMSCCANNITARSTFSLMASWMNRNPEKIVLCPTGKHMYWHKQNRDLLNTSFLTQVDF